MSEDPTAGIGGTLGTRVAGLLANATVATRQKLAPHTAGVAQKVLADFTNHVSDEVQSVMGPIWRSIATNPDTPEEIRPLMHALGNMRGQAWAWIGGTASGAALGAGLIDLLNNLLAPAILPLIAADPNAPLPPQDAASAEIRGFGWTGERYDLEWDAQAGGIDRKRWRVMQELSRARPTPEDVKNMLNRRLLTYDEARLAMRHLGYEDVMARKLLDFREEHLRPEVLADMVNRDVVSMEEAEATAATHGVSKRDFDRMVLLGGEPLSPQLLGEAFRRGFIDRATYERGIVQGPIRKEWFPTLERLQFARMSTVDAADAVNQGHITLEQGKQIAHENGLDPDDFGIIIKAAGQPPGIQFADEAFNRGFISSAQYRKMFLESRIKNEYLPLLEQMRTRLIPQETARLLYRQGVYTQDQALATLHAHGFSPADAAALLALENTRSDDNTRELTRSQIVDMYEERMFTSDEAIDMLTGMGYSADDAQAMLELADLQRLRKFINNAVSKVHSAYVTGKIDEIQASSSLDSLGIPNQSRDDYMALWDIERTTVTKTLTASQIRQAYGKQLITEENALTRLTSQGYDLEDAQLFLQLSA